MPYPVDFVDACIRHEEDAERLLAENRLANADHLYGLSAECGLKAIMTGWGREDLGRTHRRHVDTLWPFFIEWYDDMHTRSEMPEVEALEWMRNCNPFENWAIGNRYAHRGCFGKEDVLRYRAAAQAVRGMVEQNTSMEGGKL